MLDLLLRSGRRARKGRRFGVVARLLLLPKEHPRFHFEPRDVGHGHPILLVVFLVFRVGSRAQSQIHGRVAPVAAAVTAAAPAAVVTTAPATTTTPAAVAALVVVAHMTGGDLTVAATLRRGHVIRFVRRGEFLVIPFGRVLSAALAFLTMAGGDGRYFRFGNGTASGRLVGRRDHVATTSAIVRSVFARDLVVCHLSGFVAILVAVGRLVGSDVARLEIFALVAPGSRRRHG